MNANHLMLIKLNVIATCTVSLIVSCIIFIRTRRRIKNCHSRKRDHFVEMKNYYYSLIFFLRCDDDHQYKPRLYMHRYDYKNFIFSTPISRALSLLAQFSTLDFTILTIGFDDKQKQQQQKKISITFL